MLVHQRVIQTIKPSVSGCLFWYMEPQGVTGFMPSKESMEGLIRHGNCHVWNPNQAAQHPRDPRIDPSRPMHLSFVAPQWGGADDFQPLQTSTAFRDVVTGRAYCWDMGECFFLKPRGDLYNFAYRSRIWVLKHLQFQIHLPEVFHGAKSNHRLCIVPTHTYPKVIKWT